MERKTNVLTAWDETNGEVLPRLSPGVGHDSTAQGDMVKYSNILLAINCFSM